jgi:hypothetical protein
MNQFSGWSDFQQAARTLSFSRWAGRLWSAAMQFVLTQIVARFVAVYLLFDSIQILRRSFAERKIEYVETDMIALILGASNWTAHRDTSPFRYWMLMTGHVMTAAACIVMTIFGWWVPDA